MPLIVHCSGVAVAATEQDRPEGLLTYASYLEMPFGFLGWKVTMAVVIVVSTDIASSKKELCVTCYTQKKQKKWKGTFTYPLGICHLE